MPFSSPFPDLDIPKTDLISYLFPHDTIPPDTPLWIDSDDDTRSLSPRQALHWIKRFALGLDRLRIDPGEIVMIFTPNHIFVPVAYLGIVGSRRVFSGANPASTVSEVAHQIQLNDAKLILVHPTLVRTALGAVQEAKVPKCQVYLFSDIEEIPVHGIQDWRSMLATHTEADALDFQRMTAEEAMTTVATVNYSSGTTGLPKGVCISHYNMVANAEQAIYMRVSYLGGQAALNYRASQKWVGLLPLFHTFGQKYSIVLAAKLHIPIYIMKRFHFEDFLHVIEKFSITSFQIAPPIMVMLSKRPETKRYNLGSLQDVLCGGAPLSKELQNEISEKLNITVYQGWGMTETCAAAIHVPVGTIDTSGSAGQLFPNTECKVLDNEGIEVAPGERGELYLRGPQICMGYLKNQAATEETLSPDGWLKTGDIVIVRDGWFWIVDRKKELIKVNAFQVAPAELEAVLLEHDKVADAAVVGITLDGNEWPRAYVQLTEAGVGQVTEATLHNWMKDRLARYKQLVGGITFVDEIPKLQSGKILRKVVREWARRDALSIGTRLLARL